MGAVENRMVVDEWWRDIEKEPEPPDGYFTRYGSVFVEKENLLEVALEEINSDGLVRDSFLEKAMDYIESNKEATEKFLKWFYPDYKED